MSRVFALVTIKDYDGEEDGEPVVRLFGDRKSALDASKEAAYSNDYVCIEEHEVEP